MPTPYVKRLAQEKGKSVAEVERLWDEAKAQAEKAGHKDDYAYITGILKRMVGASVAPMVKIEAKSRLQSNPRISYASYCAMVASLDESKVHAFDLALPGPLKKLWEEIKEIAGYLKEAGGIAIDAVIKAFRERSVFRLLKGLGFSLVKLTKAISLTIKLPSSAIFHALDALVAEFESSKLFMALDAKNRLRKLEAVIRKHPILTRLTGLTIAGLIFIIYIKAPFIGDVAFDFDLVESMLAALKGNFNLEEFFTSPDAIHTMVVLLFGGLTGGFSVIDYGTSALARAFTFLGSHSEDVSAIMLAIFYAGARRARLHVKIPPQLK